MKGALTEMPNTTDHWDIFAVLNGLALETIGWHLGTDILPIKSPWPKTTERYEGPRFIRSIDYVEVDVRAISDRMQFLFVDYFVQQFGADPRETEENLGQHGVAIPWVQVKVYCLDKSYLHDVARFVERYN